MASAAKTGPAAIDAAKTAPAINAIAFFMSISPLRFKQHSLSLLVFC
jgi:hypothetical protein